MNHYRQKNPDHPSMRKPRSVAVDTEAGDDAGSADESVNMAAFARQERQARLVQARKADARVAKYRKVQSRG